ncbi:MAG: DNA methyltransferase [Anaerolineae bacterium]|nr:DNA methyltransferase [Anaerolineae bacterium]
MDNLENSEPKIKNRASTDIDEDVSIICLDKGMLLEILDACLMDEDVHILRGRVIALQSSLDVSPVGNGEQVIFRADVLQADLQQILEARTLQRAQYYISRLRRAAIEVRTNQVNDINLNRWKEYDDILTDSLWVMERRDNSGSHKAWYWGNFIPQIPHQMIARYTQRGDWVLDTFVGSGTTLIECRRLGRNGIGIELNAEVASCARAIVAQEPNREQVETEIVQGDSSSLEYEALLRARGIDHIQLLIMHPPYHDIIQFSEDPHDLSNAVSVDAFVDMFSTVVARTYPVLAHGRYLVVVIGDKYIQGEWIPLGFRLMQATIEQGYTLKSIIVKNFDETRAKREQKALWRYRALVGGFYVFKHEYIFLFQK